MTTTFDPALTLHRGGFRATPGRLQLLQLLAKEKKPLSVAHIQKKLRRTELNQVTLYRALEAFADSNILRRVDLQHDHAHYELVLTHHHHMVCTQCGRVEDFSDKLCDSVIAKALRKSNSFKTITSHSMELFGRCLNCS